MESTVIAVDVAKQVFQVGVSHHPGKVAETHRVSRTGLLRFFAERRSAVVLFEACGSSHFWARQVQQLGHRVVLLPPHAVRPYVRGNKTDRADVKGMLEAYRNEEIHPVPVKSVAQQSLAALHRLRSAWKGDRTARINLVRGVLRELGHVIPVGAGHVVPRALAVLADDSELPAPLRTALTVACEEIRTFEARLDDLDKQLAALGKQTPVVGRLLTIPGIGVVTATALVAGVGEAMRFATCRHFASYLGLTPREHSSGQVRRLGRISKRGDTYLRMLLIHGARSVLWAAKRHKSPDALRDWVLRLERLRGHNRAAVALANKMARIVWAVWRGETVYTARPLTASLRTPAG